MRITVPIYQIPANKIQMETGLEMPVNKFQLRGIWIMMKMLTEMT